MLRQETLNKRCAWAGNLPIYQDYHDKEWGRPLHEDRKLFELLILEGAQAGLSWLTVLKKRENYRKAFDGFDARKMARYEAKKIRTLLADAGIIRNRLKIQAAISNARAYLELTQKSGSFDHYLWEFVNHKPRLNHWKSLRQVPARTAESDALSLDLKQKGFRFVGSTICYAFMQASGMVNDHVEGCFLFKKG